MSSYMRLTANGIEISDTPFKTSVFLLPKQYIFNGDATILIWEDNTKTIIRKAKDDKDDKLLAFLTAYFQKNSGLSKKKANDYLKELMENK